MPIDLQSLLTVDLGLNPQSCAGQVIVVSGAGQGIGLQTARAFALLGGKVILAEISPQGREAEERIRNDGGEALYVQTDIANAESVARLVEATHERYGAVDLLVNNAIYIRQATVAEMPLEEWDRTIAVDLRGTFLTCKAFLPEMLSRRSGTILNLISTDAMPGLSAYIASKQGILGFSQSLALETASAGVRVVPFAPGMVDTPGIRSVAEGLAPRLGMRPEQFLGLSLHPAYEGLMPAEHAGAAAVYLALHLADEYHGQVVNGYEVLERAGLLRTKEELLEFRPEPQTVIQDTANELIELARQLEQILGETEVEFSRLPVFVRPMARSGFKSKSGMSLPDWRRLVMDIISRLEAGQSPTPSGNLPGKLDKLAGYYNDVPKETARFTRDPEMLRQVAELSSRRVSPIQALKERLGK